MRPKSAISTPKQSLIFEHHKGRILFYLLFFLHWHLTYSATLSFIKFYCQRNSHYLFVFSMIKPIITKTINSQSLTGRLFNCFLTASMCVLQTVGFHCGLQILLKLHKLSDELAYEQIATDSPSWTTRPTELPSRATRTPNRGDRPCLGSLSSGSLIL